MKNNGSQELTPRTVKFAGSCLNLFYSFAENKQSTEIATKARWAATAKRLLNSERRRLLLAELITDGRECTRGCHLLNDDI